MPHSPTKHDRSVTTLSLEQREWIRRQGRLARALEAAQRMPARRFARSAGASPASSRSGPRVSSP